MASGAGYNLRTTTANKLVVNFVLLAISNLSATKNITLKFDAADAGELFYTILPLQTFAMPLIGDSWEQISIFQDGGSMSVLTDGKITDIV